MMNLTYYFTIIIILKGRYQTHSTAKYRIVLFAFEQSTERDLCVKSKCTRLTINADISCDGSHGVLRCCIIHTLSSFTMLLKPKNTLVLSSNVPQVKYQRPIKKKKNQHRGAPTFILNFTFTGGELFEYILARRYLKEKDAKRLFAQLISGVRYMHEKHIVHRDLKLVRNICKN